MKMPNASVIVKANFLPNGDRWEAFLPGKGLVGDICSKTYQILSWLSKDKLPFEEAIDKACRSFENSRELATEEVTRILAYLEAFKVIELIPANGDIER